jgi:hypothetical protein
MLEENIQMHPGQNRERCKRIKGSIHDQHERRSFKVDASLFDSGTRAVCLHSSERMSGNVKIFYAAVGSRNQNEFLAGGTKDLVPNSGDFTHFARL